jgi:hypothetical protein
MNPVESPKSAGSAAKHEVQQITIRTDSREILANARGDIDRYKLNDYFIVDVDSHHVEFDCWSEILVHREITLVRRARDSMGIQIQVVFPQPMPEIGSHPEPEIATALTFAYNRWFTRTILRHEKRVKVLLSLPFHDPEACLKMIQEFAETAASSAS